MSDDRIRIGFAPSIEQNRPRGPKRTSYREAQSLGETDIMRIPIYLLGLTPLALAGCVIQEPAPVTTTTEVTREVTTTGPVTREVVVTQAPPVVRVETQSVSPGPNYIWTRGYWRWTGASY